MSESHKKYLNKIKYNKILVLITQITLVAVFLIIWEYFSNKGIISSFIYGSPSRIIKTIYELYKYNNLFLHIYTTLKEVLISFILGIIISFFISIILYEFKFISKVIDPFLTMLNSLPKIALGPLIIIIFGSNIKSIIIMALLINLITCTINIYNGFLNIDYYHIILFKSLNANRLQTLIKLVIPSSYINIISSFKICISQTLIGVIMGEFLVSKMGIGYIITYGKQIFNLNYVLSGIFILAIQSYLLYKIVIILEKNY